MIDLGKPVRDWTPRPWPQPQVFDGAHVRLEPLNDHHTEALFAAFAADQIGKIWAYLPYGPFSSLPRFEGWVQEVMAQQDLQFYAFCPHDTGHASGVAALMRIDPDHGVIEVGHINFAPGLQRTVAATEGLYLLLHYALETLGYRRFEWKCNALNAASRRAAQRLGFTFEGVFRQANVIKGYNRDTAWFSLLDSEWPSIRNGFAAWLNPRNFDPQGSQRRRLAECRTQPRE